jgi:hypothetical protein
VFLSFSILASLGSNFFPFTANLAGGLQIVAAALLWSDVPLSLRWQSLCLALLGLAGLFWASGDVSVLSAVSRNQRMIAMLAAIGILRLVSIPVSDKPIPVGRRALWQTLFGIHWLGAFINVSAIVIFGDHLSSDRRHLSAFQGLILTRGFALAALWSPFFVALGVALINAPGAHYLPLLLWGLPLSQGLLAVFVCYQIHCHPEEVDRFVGYPFTMPALLSPVVLTVLVIVGHLFLPAISIIALITIFAPIYALSVNFRNRPRAILTRYICEDLPKMGSEVVLFVAAGILGGGIVSLVSQQDLILPWGAQGALVAAGGLGIILIASSVGIHPVVGITTVASLLASAGVNPDLLAMSFLMGWGLGVLINPISGIHLLLSGRYGFLVNQVWRLNARYVLSAYFACCAWIFLFDSFA